MSEHTAPTFQMGAFHCPHCGAFAHQSWGALMWQAGTDIGEQITDWFGSLCQHCKQIALWRGEHIVFPLNGTVPSPHSDMPADIRADYLEAAQIVHQSPRGAAALLRLCVEKLCKQLGNRGKIDDAVGQMVKEGLPTEVQQALDVLRVIGNEAVHAGQLDLRDDVHMATSLFTLLNFVVEDRIRRPKAIRTLFDSLPPSKLEGIQKRDSGSKGTR